MSKLNKKSINLSLKVLTFLAFALIFVPFNKAAAWIQITGCGEGGCNYNFGSPTYQAPVLPAPTPVIHSSSTNPSPVMTVNYTPTKTVAVAKAKPKTVATVTNPNTGNALAANAVFGSNGFLPSGIIQWILFAMATLLVVILARTIFGAKAAYHAAPLKHE